MSCVDLPRIVDIENVKVTVTFLANVFGFLTENCQLELFDKITRTEQSFDGLLFFTQDVCVAIIPCKADGGSQSQYHGHNIMRIFDVLPNFPFTTSETKPGYY